MITLSVVLGGHFVALGGGLVVLGRLVVRVLWHFVLSFSRATTAVQRYEGLRRSALKSCVRADYGKRAPRESALLLEGTSDPIAASELPQSA